MHLLRLIQNIVNIIKKCIYNFSQHDESFFFVRFCFFKHIVDQKYGTIGIVYFMIIATGNIIICDPWQDIPSWKTIKNNWKKSVQVIFSYLKFLSYSFFLNSLKSTSFLIKIVKFSTFSINSALKNIYKHGFGKKSARIFTKQMYVRVFFWIQTQNKTKNLQNSFF